MSPRRGWRWPALWSYVVISLVAATLGGFAALGISGRTPVGWPFGRGVKAPQVKAADPKAGSTPTPSSDEARTIDVVKRVGPAVVMINTRVDKVAFDFFRRPVVAQEEGLGSGFVMNTDGYILTNNHVIADASSILVTLPGGEPVKGKLVGGDQVNDIAVVKIPARKDLPVAKLGDSTKLQVGQGVIAIGNPFGFDNTVTTGVVSALGRSLPTDESNTAITVPLQELIQTDASINPGNSGGPLLNEAGEVVGINTAIISEAQGLGFAIPVHIASQVADDLVRHGKVLRLGIFGDTLSPAIADQLQSDTGKKLPVSQGVFVAGVEKGSAAAEAGVRSGDVLTELNGRKITKMEDVRPIVRQAGFGAQVIMEVVRNGQRLRLRGTL